MNASTIVSKDLFLKRSGLLLRSLLNDLKRDVKTAAHELNIEISVLEALLHGEKAIPYELIQRAVEIWPVNERDFFPIHDDAPNDILIFRSEESCRSRRILQRGGKDYYEYRDTAMSRIALFRPEWIEMLVTVDDDSPYNPEIHWNRGHFLYQFTFFSGPINYYYEYEGQKFCIAMNTGDSVFGLPYFPHTFAKRENTKGYILALTFGSRLLGDSQQELAVLGKEKAAHFCISDSKGNFSFFTLIHRYCENASLPLPLLTKKASMTEERMEAILEGKEKPTLEELSKLAGILGVTLRDLLPPHQDTIDGVKIQRFSESQTWHYPGENSPDYLFRELAASRNLFGMHAFLIHCLSTHQKSNFLQSSLHQYGYNMGNSPLRLCWVCEERYFEEVLAPGDSIYIKPFVPHRFLKMSEHSVDNNSLDHCMLVLRIPGKLATDEIMEAALLGSQSIARFVSDHEQWY